MTSFQWGIAGIGVVVIALVALDTLARRRETRPTIGDVFGVLVSRSSGRFLVLLGWWWLGWHFFVR